MNLLFYQWEIKATKKEKTTNGGIDSSNKLLKHSLIEKMDNLG
jgi:hypothetical protein